MDQPEATALLPRTDTPSVYRTLSSAVVVFITLIIGSKIATVAQLAILEDLVCRQHYGIQGAQLDPKPCKIEPVQSEVAFINSWKDVMEILPGTFPPDGLIALLLAVPYGALADRIGRKKVLLLAILGCFLGDVWVRLVYWFPGVFPLRSVIFAGFGQAVGAGAVTLSSVIFVIIADVCPPDKRITAFAQIQCMALLSELIFIPVGASMMAWSNWAPMIAASVVTLLALLGAALLIPETLSPKERHAAAGPWFWSTGGCDAGWHERLARFAQNRKADLVSAKRWLAKHEKAAVLLLAFFFYHLGETGFGPLLLQYASKRLGCSLAKASVLLSLRAGINIAVLLVLVPAASQYLLHKARLSAKATDKRIAQGSGVLLSIGAVVISVAASWGLLTAGQTLLSLGWSFSVPARSLITGMVEKDELATVYTTISIMTYGGILLGTPFLTKTFQWGMQSGGVWEGLPFLVAGAAFVVATLVVSTTRTDVEEDELQTDP